MKEPPPSEFLGPTRYLDCEHAAVSAFTRAAIGGVTEPADKAARLFNAVRDRIWYDPYTVSTDPRLYRASHIAISTRAYCVPKAVLLAAAARAANIPARLGFADVRNHLQTPALRERMDGHDVFRYHGYAELHVHGRWVKATPAFNVELCARFGVDPMEFDGSNDALLHAYTSDGARHMEYLRDHGWYADLPLAEILTVFRNTYGEDLFEEHSTPHDAFTF